MIDDNSICSSLFSLNRFLSLILNQKTKTKSNFGAHLFYLGKKKLGLITLGITIVFVSVIGFPLFFTGALANAFAFLIPYFVLEILMIISGVMILVRHDIVDGKGAFLK